MNNNFGQRGTLRKKEEPEESHWLWEAVGAMLALAALSWLGAWGLDCGKDDVMKQPEALRLCEKKIKWTSTDCMDAAAELRRLHEVNQELLEALQYIVGCSAPMTGQQEECWKAMRAALAKATGGQS